MVDLSNRGGRSVKLEIFELSRKKTMKYLPIRTIHSGGPGVDKIRQFVKLRISFNVFFKSPTHFISLLHSEKIYDYLDYFRVVPNVTAWVVAGLKKGWACAKLSIQTPALKVF